MWKPYNHGFIVMMLNEENTEGIILCDPRHKYKKFEHKTDLTGEYEEIPIGTKLEIEA